MNRLGIIVAGVMGFALIAAACVWQQASEIARAVHADPPTVHTSTNAAPVPASALPLPSPMLGAEFTEATLVLTGRLPDAALRDAVVARATALYRTVRVIDRIEIGAFTHPAWLATPFPPDLRDAYQATALLQDGRLLVEGETSTDAAKARIDAALNIYRTQGIPLDNRLNSGLIEAGIAVVNDLPRLQPTNLTATPAPQTGGASPSARCAEGRSTAPTDGTTPCSNSR